MLSQEKMRKRKTKKKPTNPPLPDDLLLNCVAHVSRLYYPTLSLVSKRFRSLLASPELYKARSLLGRTESCLYVCFQLYPRHNTRWFTLCLKPDQTLSKKKKKKSSGYVLATLPIPHSPPACFSSLVAVGSNIYNIGGSSYQAPFSSVSVLDCQSHTWGEAPSLREELMSLSASVLNGKIYVAGSCKDGDSNSLKDSFQVFDTKTQIWDHVPTSSSEKKRNFYSRSACIDREIHVVTRREMVAYNAKEGRFDLVGVGPEMGNFMFSDSYCEIENVLYSASNGEFKWYDTELRMWRNLEGLVGLPKFPPGVGVGVRLADYFGNIAVFWDENLPYCGACGDYKKMIWCAEIALERRQNYGIWGRVEWFDHVLTVPMTYVFQKVLTATV